VGKTVRPGRCSYAAAEHRVQTLYPGSTDEYQNMDDHAGEHHSSKRGFRDWTIATAANPASSAMNSTSTGTGGFRVQVSLEPVTGRPNRALLAA